jgi:(p)ppGpp synthase/HD superfamily hydrolase
MTYTLQRPLTHRFDQALAFASDVHRSQGRKGTQIPYLAHILGVASIALEYGADEDEAIGAVLHDAIEDAPEGLGADAVRKFIQLKFGRPVLDLVEACTDADITPKPPWRLRKETYIASIVQKDASALLVSAADKVHNVRAILTDYRNLGVGVFQRFNPDAGKDGTLWYYEALAAAIPARSRELRDGRVERLASELGRLVATLRAEVQSGP